MNLDNLKLEIDNIKNKTNELSNLVSLFEKVILIGNGGSNAMASHISVDYTIFLNKKSFSLLILNHISLYLHLLTYELLYSSCLIKLNAFL